ncbi:MAG: hypothetical protein HDS68_04570 [Bacteroidales bacterium]|nr:hypothetical protein [Bacteroidales bacterium]
MSKTQLKKEIKNISRDQLEQMILEAYDARKEIKQYFDFFLNPDVDKLTERYTLEINKEFGRSKRGYSKARITNVRRLYKEFKSYHPGFDKEIELLMHIIRVSLKSERVFNLSETMIRGIGSLLNELVNISDKNLVADKVWSDLTTLLDDTAAGTRYFRKYLREQLESYRPT